MALQVGHWVGQRQLQNRRWCFDKIQVLVSPISPGAGQASCGGVPCMRSEVRTSSLSVHALMLRAGQIWRGRPQV